MKKLVIAIALVCLPMVMFAQVDKNRKIIQTQHGAPVNTEKPVSVNPTKNAGKKTSNNSQSNVNNQPKTNPANQNQMPTRPVLNAQEDNSKNNKRDDLKTNK